jgi:hypothetical protein
MRVLKKRNYIPQFCDIQELANFSKSEKLIKFTLLKNSSKFYKFFSQLNQKMKFPVNELDKYGHYKL